MKKLSLLALLSVAPMLVAIPDWPSVNFNNHNTRSNPTENILNPTNVATIVQKWQFLTTATVQVAPIIFNDVVYFGDVAGNFYALNAADGTTAFASVFLGAAVDAPATVANNKVYVATADLNLHVLNLDLTPNLAFNGGAPVLVDPAAPVAQADILSGPVLAENVIIVPITGGGSGVNGVTQNINPTLHGTINAFDATTGAFLWRVLVSPSPFGSDGGSWSTAAVDTKRKLIFLGTANANNQPAGPQTDALLAINYTTGKIKWVQQFTKGDAWGALYPEGCDCDIGASPNLFTIKHKGRKIDVVGVSSKRSCYKVFERSSGKLIWKTNLLLGSKFVATAGPGAAYANGVIYAPGAFNDFGLQLGVFAVTGAQCCDPLCPNPAGTTSFNAQFGISTPSITNIVALDANTGKIKWVDQSTSVTGASLTEANGVIYHNNFAGIFRGLDAANGTELFSFSLGGLLLPGPITVTGGNIFIALNFVSGPKGVSMFALP